MVNYLIKRIATDDNIAKVDASIHNLKQDSLTATDYVQDMWTKRLRFGSVYNKEILIGLSIEGVHSSVFWTFIRWWSEQQHSPLEDLVEKAESFIDLQ